MQAFRILSWAALVAAAACASRGEPAPMAADERAPMADGRDALSAEDYRFYRITRDPRSCAWPSCGGYVVVPVNGASAPCETSAAAPECYVADIDWRPAELSLEEGRELASTIPLPDATFSLLLLGRVEPVTKDGQATRVLAVSEVWRAVAPVSVTATLHHATRATIPCRSAGGCLAADTVTLNTWTAMRTDVDLTGAPAARMDLNDPVFSSCGAQRARALLRRPIAELALASKTGLIVASPRSASALTVTGFFVKSMPNAACDHGHTGGEDIECCGFTGRCRVPPLRSEWALADAMPATSEVRGDPTVVRCSGDHILGGIVEYERSKPLEAWLTATGQPITATAHGHALGDAGR